MKGVLLVGGHGTRLDPLTKVTNKHLLPLYHRPVVYYAIDKMVDAGIDRIMIVTAPRHVDDFVNLLGSGQRWKSRKAGKQIQIVYAIQSEPTGIAQALWIAKDYVGSDNCMLYLGDNIIEDDLSKHVAGFTGGATVFVKKVDDPERFGVATFDKDKRITKIEEKPKNPESNFAVTGIYLYDNTVFEKMYGMSASERGEYEISDVNNVYCKEGTLRGVELSKQWFDVGTFDSLLEASNYIMHKEKGEGH